jgi:hypothetical protein
MAIGPKGEVTTTGLMNNQTNIPEAPDMSAMNQASDQAEAQAPQQAVEPIAQKPEVKDPQIVEKLNNLSEEEAEQLSMVLSPSLSSILKKVVPEASDLISQFTSAEENVILPVSVVKNFARKKYPSNTEQESIQGFITELSESQSDDTNNVPPENMRASNPNGMMVKEPNTMQDTDAIDQGLV